MCLFLLCLRMAKDPRLIPERLRPFFFGARLTSIGKKDGGIRPIVIGTIFHKIVSSAIMTPHQKASSPWSLLRLSSSVWYPGQSRKTSCMEFGTLYSLTRAKSSCLSRPPERLQLCQQKHLYLGRPGEVPPVFSAGRYKRIWEPIQAHLERMQTHQFSCGHQTR